LSSKLELTRPSVIVACPNGSRSFHRLDETLTAWIKAGFLIIIAVAEDSAESLLLSTELHDEFELVFDANGTGTFSTVKAGLEGLQGRGASGTWLVLLEDLEAGRVPDRFWITDSTKPEPSRAGVTWLDRAAIRNLLARPASAAWPE
jgi:hypothetical protein